jgi:hypothetical protein
MIKSRKPLPAQLEAIKQRLVNQEQPPKAAKIRAALLAKVEPTWRCR